MKNNIVLIRPTLELKEKALEYRKEHFQHGEKIICGSKLFDKTESYEEWLSSVTRNTNPKTQISTELSFLLSDRQSALADAVQFFR